MAIRVLGIDPGLTRCGVGVIELGSSRSVRLKSVEVFTSSPDMELSARIGSIGDSIEKLIRETKPDSIALERVFSQANVRSVMGTAQISGVVFQLAHKFSIPIALHTPTEVKAAVTGSGRANKAQVGNMVARILGLTEIPKPADAADALAIAICHAWKGSTANSENSTALTPAQQKWHAAAEAAKSNKRR